MRAIQRQPAERSGSPVPGRARQALQDAGWTAAIVLPCALVAILTTRLLGPLALFWPANAVLLGMLLRHPERASAAGWLGALVAFLAADRIAGTGWAPTLWLNSANMTGVAAGYLAATRLLPAGALRLDQPRAMLSMLVVCLAGAGAEALVGGAAGPVLFGRALVPSLLDWFNGQLAIDIIVLPLFLAAPRSRPLGGFVARLRAPSRWHPHDVLPVAALALSLALAIVLGGPGVLALPVPALIWCALRYPVFPTLVLTALMSTAQLFAIVLGLLRLPDIDLLYLDALLSARLGIALVALGPMAVAIVNGARNDLLHRLDHLARHDHLTGALRRGAFLDRAGALLAERAAAGEPAAVLMVDVDHFKQVNDRFGHAGGDRVLAAVAAALQAELPRDAILGRLGGEEFAVLLPGAGAAQAGAAAERLRRRVAALPLPGVIEAGGPPPAGVTASFGLASCDARRPQGLEQLLARADAALYAAKAAGRNRVEAAEDPGSAPSA
ncbi:diguanylate cyclase (GGDEF) domain-containing protein [Methylobacterium sp. 174MFSha1.1]|uniref:GGDEF domain-containing protein n=1 Tax=Methylobacterium sp. 174MFSha1.1 TaxID=1502749 RepID=UPI0008E9972F|nr:diguanylate cyclase [Methylobacterium sp. 174MFSha1.1]SFU78280.1 diguanylate cyclase (GGDEF) domain-containing protein [Methylobacterium sp. 174MFSha1.1]